MHGIHNASSAADVQDLADIHERGKDRTDSVVAGRGRLRQPGVTCDPKGIARWLAESKGHSNRLIMRVV
jgi:hypothetical protein